MPKELIKGNEAVIKGALLAGCTHYFGYPITPASEIAEAAAYYFPLMGGTFIQAESEVASINMVYGAAAAGKRVMTASSGPGLSLKQEGISYCAGAELPCVIVDVMRAGPGLGNIWPEQGDYNQIVKGGGHGNYRNIVLAPNSAQEMCDLTMLAFELADKYRNPCVVLTDAYIGQMMEPVEFPTSRTKLPRKEWALLGDRATKENLITSILMNTQLLEEHNRKLQQKYQQLSEQEVRFETIHADDAELILVGYGIISRLLLNVAETFRAEGKKVGLFRPITLFPFPSQKIAALCETANQFLVVELSNGQMLDDVRLAANGRRPVQFYSRMGGAIPTVEELIAVTRKYI
ncbi:MAG: 3-methyl-2-oxobutanoate dehydrogenase subunit VorB [candidate division KSB1 bacterium]|nr:3-methyl-2-oxobutanoate dehydrogenase subunit VorB [candidate division KSB1 bacterium]MDZ7318786.1 3-methyl-2-oxobutanoate dehydrogenase subunit VorB [candidate division KSB1 bacterium]